MFVCVCVCSDRLLSEEMRVVEEFYSECRFRDSLPYVLECWVNDCF